MNNKHERPGMHEGRGINYSVLRSVTERILRFVYGTDWAARTWEAIPFSCRPSISKYSIGMNRALISTPLTIGFVSDLHIGPTTPVSLLENAFDLLSRANPDVIILGGDYVFLGANEKRMDILSSLLRRLHSRIKVAVMGNHDLWANDTLIGETLASCGVSVLVNESLRLPAPYDSIVILGLDEPRAGSPDPEKALAGSIGAKYRIGVCHSPAGARGLLGKVDVFLAGHTHGGQIALPFGIPMILPRGSECRKWPRGRHASGKTEIIVSRGIGATELPIRLFSSPEIVLITLVPGPVS